jgi:alpha-galactosidase
MIRIDPAEATFHLSGGGSSYVLCVLEGAHLAHGYWGPALGEANASQMVLLGSRSHTAEIQIDQGLFDKFQRNWSSEEGSLSDIGQFKVNPVICLERFPAEYPMAGTGDLRSPGLMIRYPDGTSAGRLEYSGHKILDGIPGPSGLPYVSAPPTSCQTLRMDLKDPQADLTVELYYLPLPDLPIILRWSRIRNHSEHLVTVLQAASASLDLPRFDADFITLDGSWAKERLYNRRQVSPGIQSVESRGGSSSHQHAPFMALADREMTETAGRLWSLSLIYSGNHRHLAEMDQYRSFRLQAGINPYAFSIALRPGEHFDTPAAVLCSTDSGLTGLSDAHHAFVRDWLLPEHWRGKDRPIVANTWEARYFDVNADNILELAKQSRDIGAEVLVLDDGWFENRRDDRRALGDWTPDSGKFPDGLDAAVKRIRDADMEFGLWVEPEMVSPDSELFRRHPDWILHAPGRPPTLSRNQLILDLSRPDVVEYLLDVFSGLFSSASITYVKWDMNRRWSEVGNPTLPPEDQGSVAHRYMLGLYRLWSTLVARFPHILFEGCAGGGGRFDYGSLAYMPQYWTSDQTDAVERQRIQFGSSLLFPPETMGAHVSAVPNHQVGRVTSPETRTLTALCFNFGYELDIAAESPRDKAVYAAASELYREKRSLFRSGRFLRLLPGQEEICRTDRPDRLAWMVISRERDEAMVFYFQTLSEPNDDGIHLRLRGLDRGCSYRDVERDVEFDSAFLEHRGLWLPPAAGDFRSAYWILEKSK